MRLYFAGTPEIAVPTLQTLAATGRVVGVLTNPDRPAGRGRHREASPVKAAAERLDLPVHQPEKLDASYRELVQALEPDLLVVVAFGRIFRPAFLDLFPAGGINLHPSALPRWRGPSPLSAAIRHGDDATAWTVQRLALEMDSGDILLQQTVPLNGTETTGSLTERAAREGAELVLQAVEGLEAGTLEGRPQDHQAATFCRLLKREDGLVDWKTDVGDIDRLIRSCDPWPRAYTWLGDRRLSLLEAVPAGDGDADPAAAPGTVLGMDKKKGILVQTGGGALAVRRLQLQAKKALDFRSFLNGMPDLPGCILGEAP